MTAHIFIYLDGQDRKDGPAVSNKPVGGRKASPENKIKMKWNKTKNPKSKKKKELSFLRRIAVVVSRLVPNWWCNLSKKTEKSLYLYHVAMVAMVS